MASPTKKSFTGKGEERRSRVAVDDAPPPQEDSFIYDGILGNVPDWVDKGWATYDAGPALAVPNGDPMGQPYTTTVARIGDRVTRTNTSRDRHPRHDRFSVTRAEQEGRQPGDQDRTTNLPAQTTQASLEDLEKTGLLAREDMTPEQLSQLQAREASNALASGAGAAPPSGSGLE